MPRMAGLIGLHRTGLLMGYTREAAARYSFLLAVPAVMAFRTLSAL